MTSIDFFPGGDTLISSSSDMTIKMWDVNTGYCTFTVKEGHDDKIKRVAVN